MSEQFQNQQFESKEGSNLDRPYSIEETLKYADTSYLYKLYSILSRSTIEEKDEDLIDQLDADSLDKIGYKISDIRYYFPQAMESVEIKMNYKQIKSIQLGTSKIETIQIISENEIYAGDENGMFHEVIDGISKSHIINVGGPQIEKIQALPNGNIAILTQDRLGIYSKDSQGKMVFQRYLIQGVFGITDFNILPSGNITLISKFPDGHKAYMMHRVDESNYKSEFLNIDTVEGGEFDPQNLSVGIDGSILFRGEGGIALLRNLNGKYHSEMVNSKYGWYFDIYNINPGRVVYKDSNSDENEVIYESRLKEGEWIQQELLTKTVINNFQPLPNGGLLTEENRFNVVLNHPGREEIKFAPFSGRIGTLNMLPNGKIITTYTNGNLVISDGEEAWSDE